MESTPRPIALRSLGDRPLVSVLISNYNYEGFVGAAIESVREQTYERLEIIVVDDGSTDSSAEVIRSHADADDRVRLIAQENRGQAAAMNVALRAAKGPILCLLDADDRFAPNKVAEVVAHLGPGTAGMFVHRLQVVDEHDVASQTIPLLASFEQGWLGEKILARGGRWRQVPTSGISFVAAAADEVFPIPEEAFRISADSFVFTLMPLCTTVAAVDDVLGFYRLHGANSYGESGIDLASVKKTLESMTGATEEVNARLRTRTSGVQIDVTRHLTYLENRYLVPLFEGERRTALLAAYTSLVPHIVKDDLYGWTTKCAALFLYGVAILLPVRRRPAWISSGFGLSRARELLRKLVR
ncbi:MAG: hypothetical protein QOH90_282 [Actinomycetota bacterium]|nr:hypothetical protein [Actinomycetota bacterium]